MRLNFSHKLKTHPVLAVFAIGLILAGAAVALVSCGSNTSMPGSGMGSATVSISDPPSCAVPSGDFLHVFITIRSVQAHISAAADDSSPGWQELAP